jgi:hypothetical protein
MEFGKLQVRKADDQDVYRDIVRVPENHRRASDGSTVNEGEVCEIKVRKTNRCVFVILRGKEGCQDAAIWMDERTRNRLGLSHGEEVPLEMRPVNLYGQWRWAWSSSDPAYRVSARLALLSVLLGAVGVILGLVGVWLSCRSL